jgi:spore maturation protein CgeB
LQRLFLTPARLCPERRFVLAGAMYPQDFPWLNNVYFVRHLPPPEHASFYASSRITLNVTRAAMAAAGWCPSGRLFEAAACGVPVLSDAWPGLDTFFTPGREILVARDTGDALTALERSDADLALIARSARERVLDEHTASHRARQMVAAFESAAAAEAL